MMARVMSTLDKNSVRGQVEKLKNDFKQLRREGKVTGSFKFRVGYLIWGLNFVKSSLPAIRKITVLMVSILVYPRALRLAA